MTSENQGLRGKWLLNGRWECDCRSKGHDRTHSASVSSCRHCTILRPTKKDWKAFMEKEGAK